MLTAPSMCCVPAWTAFVENFLLSAIGISKMLFVTNAHQQFALIYSRMSENTLVSGGNTDNMSESLYIWRLFVCQ